MKEQETYGPCFEDGTCLPFGVTLMDGECIKGPCDLYYEQRQSEKNLELAGEIFQVTALSIIAVGVILMIGMAISLITHTKTL